MALRAREHRRRLTVGLAEEAVGGASDEPVCLPVFLHQLEELLPTVRGQGEMASVPVRILERAREVYAEVREQGRDRIGAGLAALRTAAGRHVELEGERGAGEAEELRERLAQITGRVHKPEQGEPLPPWSESTSASGLTRRSGGSGRSSERSGSADPGPGPREGSKGQPRERTRARQR